MHKENNDGSAVGVGFVVGEGGALAATAQASSARRTAADLESRGADRYFVRLEDRHSLGGSASGNGLWIGDDLLAASP